jgi:3-phenylpropionate/cinnamic acid dioxygenase small subunit
MSGRPAQLCAGPGTDLPDVGYGPIVGRGGGRAARRTGGPVDQATASTDEGGGQRAAATSFDDWHAIQNLISTYAELVDSGRFEEAAAMFEHADYGHAGRDGGPDQMQHGSAEVLEYMAATTLHDGSPRTRHVNTNVIIELDGDTATSRCYLTVFQQTDTLPLQAIATARYVDRFERTEDGWRFTYRFVTDGMGGDTSQHKAPAGH